ncbi:MAG: hypothetical protein NW203_13305 [Hyphomonadaceae bacterium]|nr:hypothetical protein [Hyphomonadaceae bacterium]
MLRSVTLLAVCGVATALALWLAAAPPLLAQSIGDRPRLTPPPNVSDAWPEQLFTMESTGAPTRLSLRFQPGAAGRVVGRWRTFALQGWRIADPSGERAAWIAYRENGPGAADDAPALLFTAERDAASGAWLGATYALSAADGGTALANGAGFRALPLLQRRFCPGGPCPPPPAIPAAPATTSTPRSLATPLLAFVDANGTTGMIYARATAGGDVTGRFLFDDIRGHYAASGGAIAFLRFNNGRPIQGYVGLLQNDGSISGRGFPVAREGGGPASYDWRHAHLDTVVAGIGSLRNQDCLDVDGDASTTGALLITTPCDAADGHQVWGLIRTTAQGWQAVSMPSGLCMRTPLSGETQYRLAPCAAATTQRWTIQGAAPDPSAVSGWFIAPIDSASDFGVFPQFELNGPGALCPGIYTEGGERVSALDCFDAEDLFTSQGELNNRTYWALR